MRKALVTGANRGVGQAVCVRLHELGYQVVVTARDERAARSVADAIGENATAVALDVTDAASVQRARESAGDVDILVNNAGILLDRGERAATISADLVERHLAVNMTGAWQVTQAFLPGMLDRKWGRIVMVSSGAGAFSYGFMPDAPAYSVSKAALNALTVLLAKETRGTGVLVNAVTPGPVRTRMLPTAERSPAEAAAGVVEVATLPDDGPSGVFFRHGRPAEW